MEEPCLSVGILRQPDALNALSSLIHSDPRPQHAWQRPVEPSTRVQTTTSTSHLLRAYPSRHHQLLELHRSVLSKAFDQELLKVGVGVHTDHPAPR